MEYSAEEKENYLLLKLGSTKYSSDRDLPIPDQVAELSFKKRKIVLEISNLETFSSPLMCYIVTLIANNPMHKADVVAPTSEKISRLENLLEASNISKYVNVYESVEEYESSLH